MVSRSLPLWCCPWSLSGKSAGKCARPAYHLQNPQVCDPTNQLYMRVRLSLYCTRGKCSCCSRPPRIPLSAFVVGDMNEFVQAHATYRFVIFDEEDERPRMLVSICHLRMFPQAHYSPSCGCSNQASALHIT